jgi:hypothetical protein
MKDNVLVLGAGNSSKQMVFTGDPEGPLFSNNFKHITTIDIDPASRPDLEWDLEKLPWPVPSNEFDEVHAYEVLEHLGGMGDYQFYFSLWKQIWEVLKPGGFVCATTPWWESVWAWQDPGHRRVDSLESLIYLDQKQYEAQIGKTSMSDYRRVFPPPYSLTVMQAFMNGENLKNAGFVFCLRKDVA